MTEAIMAAIIVAGVLCGFDFFFLDQQGADMVVNYISGGVR